MTSATSFGIIASHLLCICFMGIMDTGVELNLIMIHSYNCYFFLLFWLISWFQCTFGPCSSLLIARITLCCESSWTTSYALPRPDMSALEFVGSGSASFIFLVSGLTTLPNLINVGQMNKSSNSFLSVLINLHFKNPA